MPRNDPAAARLRAAAGRLLNWVEHWSQSRWSAPAQDDHGGTRAEVVHALVQRLADLVAGVEARPALPVPRLENDLVLPDQVRVMVADLGLAAAPEPVLREAVTQIDAAAARL